MQLFIDENKITNANVNATTKESRITFRNFQLEKYFYSIELGEETARPCTTHSTWAN